MTLTLLILLQTIHAFDASCTGNMQRQHRAAEQFAIHMGLGTGWTAGCLFECSTQLPTKPCQTCQKLPLCMLVSFLVDYYDQDVVYVALCELHQHSLSPLNIAHDQCKQSIHVAPEPQLGPLGHDQTLI